MTPEKHVMRHRLQAPAPTRERRTLTICVSRFQDWALRLRRQAACDDYAQSQDSCRDDAAYETDHGTSPGELSALHPSTSRTRPRFNARPWWRFGRYRPEIGSSLVSQRMVASLSTVRRSIRRWRASLWVVRAGTTMSIQCPL